MGPNDAAERRVEILSARHFGPCGSGAGSMSALAYDTMFRLASRHSLGFFDANGNGALWFPKSDGQLEMLH